jgi:hypothetical protein
VAGAAALSQSTGGKAVEVAAGVGTGESRFTRGVFMHSCGANEPIDRLGWRFVGFPIASVHVVFVAPRAHHGPTLRFFTHMTLVMVAKIIHPIPDSGGGPIEGCEHFFSEKNELFRRFWHLAQAVLMGQLFVDNTNGEKNPNRGAARLEGVIDRTGGNRSTGQSGCNPWVGERWKGQAGSGRSASTIRI